MTPILNRNLSIHAIPLKLKKDPFSSKLCSHIPSKMDPSRPPGCFVSAIHSVSLLMPSSLLTLHQIINYLKDKIGVVFLRSCVIFDTL